MRDVTGGGSGQANGGWGGGGGGGYDGGAGGYGQTFNGGGAAGTGGTSYWSADAMNPFISAGAQQGSGILQIDLLPSTDIPEPSTLALLGVAMLGLAIIRRKRSQH